ncbi:MAG: hypothetical protein ACI3XF_02790 [Eubacteriales bacterium]
MSTRAKALSFILLSAIIFSCFSMWDISAAGNMALIGEVGYAKISGAINAAGYGDTVTLVPPSDGSPLAGYLSITDKENLILDLNGITLTTSTNTYVININNSNVTIKNGSLVSNNETSGASAITVYGKSSVILENLNITSQMRGITVQPESDSHIKVLSDTKIKSTKPCFYADVADASSSLTLDIYGKLDSGTHAVYLSGTTAGKANVNVYGGSSLTAVSAVIYNKVSGSSLDISGGVISGGTGIYSIGGDICIKGGRIEATGEKGSAPNTACAVSSENSSLTIIDGEFYSGNETVLSGDFSNISIVGGMFYPDVPEEGVSTNAIFTEKLIAGKIYKVLSSKTNEDVYKITDFSAQIAMLEPWGIRVSASVTKNGAVLSPLSYDAENVKTGIWFAIGEEKYESIDAIKNAATAEYVAGTKDSEGFFGDFLGIYIFDFDKYISFTAEVTVDDKTICSGTVCLSMLELIDLRLSMDDCTGAERNLLTYMINYHAYVKAYLEQ